MAEKQLKIFNASAGSGKTYTLVQEYLRIVLHSENPMKFRSILAMTFTNKAANEMKERIIDGLIELGKPEHDKTESELTFLIATSKNLGISPRLVETRSAKILNRILHNYGSFSVMTIDKFTHKVIRTFAKDLNISIDFDVELDIGKLRKNVTDMLFDQIGRDKELTTLMLRYAQTNLSEDKSWNFSRQLFEFSQEIFKEEAIGAIDRLKRLSAEDFIRVQNDLVKENRMITDKLVRNASEALDIATSKGLTENDFQGKRTSVISYLKKIGLKRDFAPPGKRLSGYIENDQWGHKDSPNKFAADEIGPLLKQYISQIEDILENEYKTYLINREILKNLNNLSLLNHLLTLVDQIKEEENILLISDFYQKIAEVITEEPVPFIYERLGVRYEHFLLDEFQDTSHLQWINMIPLVHNSLAAKNTNLIVGDGKQAIYRWRNGEVEQFTGLPNQVYNPGDIASLKDAEPLFRIMGEKYPLKKNYRSAPEIVNFNNDLFPSIINDLPENLQTIYDDIIQEPTKTFGGYVESKFSADMKKPEQLEYILEKIEESRAKGYSLSDISILTRNNTEGAEISKYLTERGIKVISPDSLFIGKDLGVKFIISLMNAIISPAGKNHKIKTLEHFSSLLLKEEARVIIERHASEIIDKPVGEILEKYGYHIPSPTDFHNLYEFAESLVALFKLNLKTNPFLQFLLEQIHLFEKRNNSSTRDFVDWFNDRGHRTSIISPDGAEAIQVMTIHKSKGLQFPIVICPFFDWKMDLNRQISWINNTDESLPAYFLTMSKSLLDTEHSDIYNTEKGKFLLDHLNLLYVAFTRPEIALFICGDTSKRFDTPAKLWLKNYFENSILGAFDDSVFTYGNFEQNQAEAKVATDNYPLEFHKKKMNKPVLSYKSADNRDIHELDAKREFGTKIHNVLSDIHQRTDLDKTLQEHLIKGRIDQEEAGKIKTKIELLFDDLNFNTYFDAENQLNEKALISGDGRKLIPDKIILNANNTLVVDFKTGQETPDHKKQLKTYVETLREMGLPNVSGELYYTETRKIVRL